MLNILDIIKEEIMNTVANYPQFGDRLKSIDEVGEANEDENVVINRKVKLKSNIKSTAKKK